jgi:hypothetical protein
VPGPAIITLTGLVLTFGLFLLGILTAVQSVLDRRDANNIEHSIADTLHEIAEGADTIANVGKQGKQGAPGVQGEQGEKGDTGDTGKTGETGEKGSPGENGIRGTIHGTVEITPPD